MGAMASQITSHQPFTQTQIKQNFKAPRHWSLCGEFIGHRRPVNSPHKWPVTGKIFPFDDVIMKTMGILTYPLPKISQTMLVNGAGKVKPGVGSHIHQGSTLKRWIRTWFWISSKILCSNGTKKIFEISITRIARSSLISLGANWRQFHEVVFVTIDC